MEGAAAGADRKRVRLYSAVPWREGHASADTASREPAGGSVPRDTPPRESKADSWATPTDRTYLSENGKLQFFVAVGDTLGSQRKEPSGTLRLKFGEQWEGVRTNRLINRISPVQVMVHDSSRNVVTFDEYHSGGQNPVVLTPAVRDHSTRPQRKPPAAAPFWPGTAEL